MTSVLLESPLGYYITIATFEHHWYLLDHGWEEISTGNWFELQNKVKDFIREDTFITPDLSGLLKLCEIYTDFL